MIAFPIAATWRKEHEPNGVRRSAEQVRQTGTLRPNASSLKITGPISLEAAAREAFGGESVEISRNGFPESLT
jgi:hypothetical protein